MKKKNFTLLAIITTSLIYSQVGINTENPKATFDVVANPTNLTLPDGIIAPRLTGAELKAKDSSYNVEQNGSIVFVTTAVVAPTLKTVNITARGYYYFDSSRGTVGEWVKIGDGSGSSITANNGLTKTSGNIQLGGSLISPTTIATGAVNTLALTGLQAGNATTDKSIVVGADGVIKVIDKNDELYRLFHAQLKQNQSFSFSAPPGNNPLTLKFDTPLISSPLYSYDTSTGYLTLTQAGNYLVTLQAGVRTDLKNYVILGIRTVTPDQYIGRGSYWPVQAVNSYLPSDPIGDTYSYTTVIRATSANFRVRFTVMQDINPAPATGVVLKEEVGATGAGNVTNVTVQKI